MSDGSDIAEGYRDARGAWRTTDPTVAAQLRGLLIGAAVDSKHARLHFTRPDRGDELAGRWDLELEDGAVVPVHGRLPGGLPIGFHRLVSRDGDEARKLVVAPARAPRPEGRRWGWSVHTPSLRATSGRGIGDLGSLGRFASWAGESGAQLLATLPMHAPLPLTPREPSPYYPSSRVWRDPLLIDPAALGCSVAAARATDLAPVDRDATWALTRPALAEAWRGIADRERDRFERWRSERGPSLERFATHESLVEHHRAPWTSWPDSLRHPDAPAVRTHARDHSDEVAFHAWLQWHLERQIEAVSASIGLFTDLAVGVHPAGADAWCYPGLVATGARIGAPPDAFNTAGQDWGLAPFDPGALRAAAYAPFLDALRATLHGASAIRIDHIMGMFRLWWIPDGNAPGDGAYIPMPADELFDLIVLEATRAGATVVGEDLGTVEESVRTTMAERGILGTRVVWFSHELPSDLPTDCAASVTNHDLPTVRGIVDGDDAAERRALGMPVDLDDERLLRERLEGACEQGGMPPPLSDPVAATSAALRALAEGPAAIVLAGLADALGVAPRVNLPGTTTERPNWSLPLPVAAEDLPGDSGVSSCTEAASLARPGDRGPGRFVETDHAGGARSGT